MRLLNWRFLVIALLAAILSACATPSVETAVDDATFVRAGRFALNFSSNLQDPYAAQGGFRWRDSGNELVLDLSNPMGSILARVSITARQSVLRYANGDIEYADSPSQLLERLWGYAVPVAGVRYWIQGKAMPDTAISSAKYNDQQQLLEFQQLGWQVKLQNYDQLGPRRIKLLRSGPKDRLLLNFTVN